MKHAGRLYKYKPGESTVSFPSFTALVLPWSLSFALDLAQAAHSLSFSMLNLAMVVCIVDLPIFGCCLANAEILMPIC